MSKVIATHSGKFHADEALGVFLLRQLPRFKDHALIRTRDEEKIKQADVVLDVGAVYDAEKLRFDHHQRSFTNSFPGYESITKLSSAGLIFQHFGKEIIADRMNKTQDDPMVDLVWKQMYEKLIVAFDGNDNGVTAHKGDLLYLDHTGIASRVGRLNPRWNQPQPSEEEVMQAFLKAVQLTGDEFDAEYDWIVNGFLPAREIVKRAVDSRMEVDPSGQIIVLDQFGPWSEHLFDLEKEAGCEGKVLYVVFADSSGQWRVQAVPVKSGAFENRKPLPEQWRGLRDAELENVSGISGTVFCHAAGFIGGAKTKEGALEMAKKSL